MTQWRDLRNDHNSSLSLKPSPNSELLVNQFNNATLENSNGPEKKIIHLNIMTLRKCITLKYLTKNKLLSLFHINACSLKFWQPLTSLELY